MHEQHYCTVKSESSLEPCFKVCIKVEPKDHVEDVDSRIQDSYDSNQNYGDNSMICSTQNIANYVVTDNSRSEKSRSDVSEADYGSHVKLKVVGYTSSSFGLSAGPDNQSHTSTSNCPSTKTLPCEMSPVVEDHVKAEQENGEMHKKAKALKCSFQKSELNTPNCEQKAYRDSESCILPHQLQNHSILSCDDCEKAIKMESRDVAKDLTGTASLCKNVENCSDDSIKYALYDNNGQNVSLGPEKKLSNRVEVDERMMCNRDQESWSNVQVSVCNIFVCLAAKSHDESTLSKNVQKCVTSGRPKVFTCEQCGKEFDSSWKLRSHENCHSLERPFVCKHCGKAFKRQKNLEVHVLIHSEERTFSCELCAKAFKTRSNLDGHLRTHSVERPFSCKLCEKAFKTNGELKHHLVVHSEEKPFSCDQCGKAFKKHEYLEEHLRYHSEERTFSCKQCRKAFKTRANLQKHLKSHSEERPFSCEQCGKAFKIRSYLECHVLTHSEEKPFCCEHCRKAFKTRGALTSHLRFHSDERPFACKCCGQAFKARSNLDNHLLIHSDKRPFSCEQCGKAFKMRRDLKSHLIYHSEERPFSCEHCGKAFKTRRQLKNHARYHSE